MKIDVWLRASEEDALVARAIGAIAPGAAAFHWQQAVEKLLKAVFASAEVEIPRTHDLLSLWEMLVARELLPSAEPSFAHALRRVSRLAILGRHPLGDCAPSESVTKLDLEEASILYDQVFSLVKAAFKIVFAKDDERHDSDTRHTP